MKETLWYHAAYNEIWVKISRNRVERGCQASIGVSGQGFSVPDYCNLYDWKYDLKIWKQHIKKGWLVKLGDLCH